MEEKRAIKINLPILIFVFLQLIFIILIVVTINQINGEKRGVINVEVEGLADEIPNLPEYGKQDIEYGIYAAMSATTSEIRKNGIYIRDGSLIDNYYEDAGKRYVNFIADIPDAERSYRIVAEWDDDMTGDLLYDSGSGGRIGILCLEPDELIYGEFDCRPWRGYMKYVIIDSLFDIWNKPIDSNSILTVTPESNEDMENYRVKFEHLTCDTQCFCQVTTEEEKETIVKSFEEFIQGLGFKAKDFPYYFNDCSGEKMWIDKNGTFHNDTQ